MKTDEDDRVMDIEIKVNAQQVERCSSNDGRNGVITASHELVKGIEEDGTDREEHGERPYCGSGC